METRLIGGAADGKLNRSLLAESGAPNKLVDIVFHLCLRTAIILGSCYAVFVAYITMAYPRSWVEKLQMLPLVIVSIIIPLLGAAMIQK